MKLRNLPVAMEYIEPTDSGSTTEGAAMTAVAITTAQNAAEIMMMCTFKFAVKSRE